MGPRLGFRSRQEGVRHLRASIKTIRMAANRPVVDGFDPVVDGVVLRVLRHQLRLSANLRLHLRVAQIGDRESGRRFLRGRALAARGHTLRQGVFLRVMAMGQHFLE
jgi:hypothetical protein